MGSWKEHVDFLNEETEILIYSANKWSCDQSAELVQLTWLTGERKGQADDAVKLKTIKAK